MASSYNSIRCVYGFGNLTWLDSSTVHGIIGRYNIDSREHALGA